MKISQDMRRVIREQSLGFVATVCPDGTPNLSPKGTTDVWDDEHLVFLHLYSPGTVANLESNPAMEINVVDPIVRKGYRFKGEARVVASGELFEQIIQYYLRERGIEGSRVQAAVLMHVRDAAPLISPAYDNGATEQEVAKRWRERHLGIRAEPPEVPSRIR